MPECTAEANWSGAPTAEDSDGTIALASGTWEGRYATPADPDATNPEELLAAAHASCFAMTGAFALDQAGYTPADVSVDATVTLEHEDGAFSIPAVELTVDGTAPDATTEEIAAALERAEAHCPVSKALTGTDVEVFVE